MTTAKTYGAIGKSLTRFEELLDAYATRLAGMLTLISAHGEGFQLEPPDERRAWEMIAEGTAKLRRLAL